MALMAGEIDCYYAYSSPIDATLMDLIAGDENIDPGESYYAGQNQITFGMERPATGDLAVRSAILQCFDWELLANVQGGETAEIPNTSLLTPSCPGFDSSLPKFKQDVEAAKKLLDDAGYKDVDGDGFREMPDGSELRLLVVPQYSKSMDLRNRIAEVLMENMAAVGINSYIDPEMIANSEVWENNILAENYDIAIGYTTAGIAKYTSAFRYYAAEPRPGTTRESSWLWGSYHDADFNAAIWQMGTASNQEQYMEAVQYLQQVANNDLIGASLGWTKAFYPYRTDRITGWENLDSWGVIHSDTWSSLRAK
jgi:peptide/nickel transport system substrate-binding protein